MTPARTIAIVGGGLSGTLVAANLLRAPHWANTVIVLIERARHVARGKAYVEREHPYLLNVPAGRMSVHPRSPLDFLWYARRRMPHATAEDFLPRPLYGEYLESTLLQAEREASSHVRLQRLRADVCAIERTPGAGQLRVRFADGHALLADEVVLALGNPSPPAVPGTGSLQSSEHYIADPWAMPLSFRAGERLLLIGTSLTMADVATTAATTTQGTAVIHSISRHGLVPPSQAAFSDGRCRSDGTELLRAASFSMLTLLRAVRELADETERNGGDWREAVTFVRNLAPALWKGLSLKERRRMLRHVRPYWDVHRHRLPGETLTRLRQLRLRQKLHIYAGRLLTSRIVNDEAHLTWRPRGASDSRTLVVDRVINCTGPDHNIHRAKDPLMCSLLSQGLTLADPLGLGLRTGAHGALIDSAGRVSANLFYVGPLLRADHWEATAAHELRDHAEGLAKHLTRADLPAPLGRPQTTPSRHVLALRLGQQAP
ncbi:MAG TPA: FAD/NAD(P)-binding protein [Steroidobacteraceae bacterium]|nr:FAD/NAD(P)-binding protein [Steroidobacteraceae bacterium]